MNTQSPPPNNPLDNPPSPSGGGAESGGQTAALLRLLQLETDIRRVGTERELIFHLANESRGVLGFRQAFVFRRRRRWRLIAVSSVSSFDADTPLNRDLRRLVGSISSNSSEPKAQTVNLAEGDTSDTLRTYAFRHALWVPIFTRRGVPFAGVLLLRETQWPKAIVPLAERVAATYGHAWQALAGRKLERRFAVPGRALFALVLLSALALGFLPAPLSVLAPAEVTGRNTISVAATMNGMVEEVAVAPNSVVEEGTVLARYDDTELRNALEIADRATIVARAKFEKLQNASFSDRVAARELKVAEAELALALAESALARERLSRVEITAPQAGIAVFEDPRDLIGRPVSIGDRLMDIVDPSELEFTVRLPVDDSIVLREGAQVRVFLDSNPLEPVPAELTRRSYRASAHEDGSFGYTLTASPVEQDLSAARLGAQGTAQLFGDDHSLFFIVFRRPLSWLRQTFGF